MEGEVGLVAGRSQREKRRSYKDLLREEEEIDAQVRKTSKKRRDSDPFAAGNELHKKKKRTHEDENYHHKDKSHGQSLHHKKKKKKATPEGRSSHMSHAHSSSTSSSNFMPSASHTASTETAMDLLQAITSPLATGSDPSPPHHHQQQQHHQPYKKSSNTTHSHHHHHHTSSQRKQQQRGEDWDTPPHSARPRPPKKKPPLVRETLPVVGTEVELEGHYDGPMGIMGDSSSSAEELEDGELIIDDSYAQLAKKAKKSKKSKKKKEKEKDKEKERDKKHSQKGAKKVSKGGSSSHSSGMANGGAGYQFGMADSANHRQSDEKKKKEKKAKPEKDKKRRTITAYQVFCKEYRASINEEQPGLDFGELAKRLGDAWNQLPEGDKEVWKERAQYLQAKADLKSGMSSSSGKSVSQSSSSAAAKAEKPKAVKRVESRPVLLQTNGVSALEAESAPSPGEVPEVDPIDAAAHLQLLGESLSVIGCRLQETEGMVTVSGSLSVLLDAMLCALGPLACLTAQVPELNGCPQHILSKTLDNIAYVMPGL